MEAKILCHYLGISIDDNFIVKGITIDSRKVNKDYIFVAMVGLHHDGHYHIEEAVNKGARLIITEKKVSDYNCVVVDDINKALAILAYQFYGKPTDSLTIIGITGTNGKTSTSTLIANSLELFGLRSALIGTNGAYIDKVHYPLNNTTPNSLELFKLFDLIVKKDIKYVVMEVSSHGLMLSRVDFVKFHVAIFTNITNDHLDFHDTFDNYLMAKKILFNDLDSTSVAVINADSSYSKKIVENSEAKVYTYGIDSGDIKADDIVLNKDYTSFNIGEIKVETNLLAKVNIYNVLASYTCLLALGFNKEIIVEKIKSLNQISGRLEKVYNKDYLVIVDYAHTPDAIEQTLTFLKQIEHNRIITIVGCGGNRDKTKRPMMGSIATRLSDLVIFCDDNPRDEDPVMILKDITKDLVNKNYEIIGDRKKAIKFAINNAQKNDIIAILGKGNENYQIIKGKKYHFSDLEEALKCVEGE